MEESDLVQECCSSTSSYTASTTSRRSRGSSRFRPSHTSTNTNHGNDDAFAGEDLLTLRFRPLEESDYDEIKCLHEELFPVQYSPQFYSNVILNQTTNGKPLYSSIAVIQHDDEEIVMGAAAAAADCNYYDGACSRGSNRVSLQRSNMFRRLAQYVDIGSFREETELFHQSWKISDRNLIHQFQNNSAPAGHSIVGCIIGCFVDVAQAKQTTTSLLVRNPDIHRKMFYIMTLGATEKMRHKGLGKKLVKDCIEMVEQVDSCGVIYLHVITYNAAAICFYEKLGFYRMDEIKDYYQINGVKHSCYLYAYFLHGNRRSLVDIIFSACNRVVTSLRSTLPF